MEAPEEPDENIESIKNIIKSTVVKHKDHKTFREIRAMVEQERFIR
jgi:hypothetical protein